MCASKVAYGPACHLRGGRAMLMCLGTEQRYLAEKSASPGQAQIQASKLWAYGSLAPPTDSRFSDVSFIAYAAAFVLKPRSFYPCSRGLFRKRAPSSERIGGALKEDKRGFLRSKKASKFTERCSDVSSQNRELTPGHPGEFYGGSCDERSKT